ncbi:hypothetical protein Hypma_003314 [Hypsizygus marmoreus]|uniref:Uncharacterized protein n=1 Tax=Hypsizygus marmoreus TaxID=39966 RepID=A0A369J2D4_HYPMA|nr:hypothetical protein Hypma_003314 [Hypsizygus marmoreus]
MAREALPRHHTGYASLRQAVHVMVLNSPIELASSQGRHSYAVINKQTNFMVADLLRVIQKGPTTKNIVDDAIDQCSVVFNLRDYRRVTL